jgi:hypothetical protein
MRRMNVRPASLVALIAVATVTAACASPAGAPVTPSNEAASTGPTVPARDFTSEHYGFGVTLSEDWSATDASMDWDGTKLQGTSSPAFANFKDPTTRRVLVAASAPVAEGIELAEWQAAMVRAAPAGCTESPSVEETTLDGEPALAWTTSCSDGDAIKVAALHENRGYMLFLHSPGSNDADDQRIFESIRSSFRFTQ